LDKESPRKINGYKAKLNCTRNSVNENYPELFRLLRSLEPRPPKAIGSFGSNLSMDLRYNGEEEKYSIYRFLNPNSFFIGGEPLLC
jgi:hypothetical protein